MNDFLKRPISLITWHIKSFVYRLADTAFIFLERCMPQWLVLFGVNLDRIPYSRYRRGGSTLYAEWAFRIGLWRALLFPFLNTRHNATIVDIGCGTGIVALSAEDFVCDGGRYIGIDVDSAAVAFCRKQYTAPYFRFMHHAVHNRMYADAQIATHAPYPVESSSVDAVVAISVWTNLREEDARFYMREVARILQPHGHAFITMLLIDDEYAVSSAAYVSGMPFYIFSDGAYGSQNWQTVAGIQTPEHCIGITRAGLDEMLADAGLVIREHMRGRWKSGAGIYPQDILILQKK